MTNLEIVEATRTDVPALVSLYEAAGIDAPGEHSPAQAFAAWDRLQREVPTARVLIARQQGRSVATLTFFVLPLLAHGGAPEALVEDVAVHPDVQGQGIGRALMEHAMALASAAGCYKLALSSNGQREDAHRFYEHLGFARHGVSFVMPIQEESRA
jgi:GNAT superfamily N-acetyltransferase